MDRMEQDAADHNPLFFGEPDMDDYRGGCTLLIDVETSKIRLCIAKNILSDTRLERQRLFRAARLPRRCAPPTLATTVSAASGNHSP